MLEMFKNRCEAIWDDVFRDMLWEHKIDMSYLSACFLKDVKTNN